MKMKIIGIFIILSGALMLAGVVYINFFSANSFSDIFDKVWPSDQPIISGQNSDQFDLITKDTPSQEPKRVITPDKRIINATPLDAETSDEEDGYKVGKSDLIRMSGSFSERFGSYSNQSNFANILDLKIFMSKRMKYWADTFIAEQRKFNAGSGELYYGITTKAVGREMQEYDDDIGLAKVLVRTRRREATGVTSNYSNVYSQNLMITFIKEDGAWKVDSANWL